MKQRKVPLRKCIVTNEMMPKGDLIRIVRTPEGTVELDATGKKNGRGAYLTNSEDVFEAAKKRDSLSRHLQVNVSADDYERLIAERAKVKKR
ncbi:RNase P modulator RnpM [Shouchella patagoniensis]|uniref:RNase P modulator RnpM n=1 Tax=Shouchella patagoniensis TaxID=228576 RepID=UPI0009950E3C|nr:YlxR family protein [Shouchella patagoniensis]